MNKIVFFLFVLLSFYSSAVQAQETSCIFNYYNKKGSNYFFSTYYDISPEILMDGTCIQFMSNTKDIYEKRVFKNGIIQSEITNYINPTRKRTSFERVKHDSTIAEYLESTRPIELPAHVVGLSLPHTILTECSSNLIGKW